jgi:hypothetical protein
MPFARSTWCGRPTKPPGISVSASLLQDPSRQVAELVAFLPPQQHHCGQYFFARVVTLGPFVPRSSQPRFPGLRYVFFLVLVRFLTVTGTAEGAAL